MTLYNVLSCFSTKKSYKKLSEELIGTQNNTRTPEAILSFRSLVRSWKPVTESGIYTVLGLFLLVDYNNNMGESI